MQSGNDPDCKWFQQIAEQGHYAGRTQPTATRQGIYFATPNGKFLGSLNSNRWEQVAGKMEEALQEWQQRDISDRLNPTIDPDFLSQSKRKEDKYPVGGLVWKVYSRDLPRDTDDGRNDWRSTAWNQDFAWVSRNEIDQLLPVSWEQGERHKLPDAILRRLCIAHLVDNVRGQTPSYRPEHVEVAEGSVEVVFEKDGVVELIYRGETRTVAKGSWSINDRRDAMSPQFHQRGVETSWLGKASYNKSEERFEQFELVFAGTRWGATQYNGRHDDLDPAPIGFVLKMVDDRPLNRVAPELFWSYGW